MKEREATYAVTGAWLPSTLPRAILARAEVQPDAPALLVPDGAISYAALVDRGQRVAAFLLGHGLAAGDRALLVFRNHPAFVEAYVGCALAGVVPVTCHPGLGWDGALRVAEAAEARAVLLDGSEETRVLVTRLRAERPALACALRFAPAGAGGPLPLADDLYGGPRPALPPPPDDPSATLVLLLSSGSTGAPKLVPRSHRGFGGASRRFGELWGARPGARFGVGSMMGHAAALGWGVQAALLSGAALCVPVDRRPAALLEAFARAGVETAFLVPSQGRALLAAGEADPSLRVPSLRRIIFGGERFEPALAHRLQARFGAAIQNTYGMTEGFCTATDPTSLDELEAGVVGRPCFEEDELRVTDEAGAPVPPGEVGELWVRGPACVDGYWRQPLEAHRERFSPDGFFRTGDRVRLLDGRRIAYVGRTSALINRGGVKISPEDLEYHLHQHPAVEQAIVVGVRDEALGERICALVRPRGAARLTADGVREFLADRGLGKARQPDRVHLVDSLPLNAIGKLDRAAAASLAYTLPSP